MLVMLYSRSALSGLSPIVLSALRWMISIFSIILLVADVKAEALQAKWLKTQLRYMLISIGSRNPNCLSCLGRYGAVRILSQTTSHCWFQFSLLFMLMLLGPGYLTDDRDVVFGHQSLCYERFIRLGVRKPLYKFFVLIAY